MSRKSTFGILLMASFLVGCFQYVPVERGEITPRSRLRVEFAGATDLDLSTGVTVRDVVRVDGHAVQQRGDTLVIRLTRIEQAGSREMTPPDNELFWIPFGLVRTLKEKDINGPRTALLAGGMSVGGGALAGLVLGGNLLGLGESEKPDNEDPSQRDSPQIRVVIPLPLFGGR